MAKHIKVKATYYAREVVNRQVGVRILEQTHRTVDFGRSLFDSTFEHGKVELLSYSFPDISVGFRLEMYLRGSDTGLDHKTVYMSVVQWNQVKAAIEAYNKKFA